MSSYTLVSTQYFSTRLQFSEVSQDTLFPGTFQVPLRPQLHSLELLRIYRQGGAQSIDHLTHMRHISHHLTRIKSPISAISRISRQHSDSVDHGVIPQMTKDIQRCHVFILLRCVCLSLLSGEVQPHTSPKHLQTLKTCHVLGWRGHTTAALVA